MPKEPNYADSCTMILEVINEAKTGARLETGAARPLKETAAGRCGNNTGQLQ